MTAEQIEREYMRGHTTACARCLVEIQRYVGQAFEHNRPRVEADDGNMWDLTGIRRSEEGIYFEFACPPRYNDTSQELLEVVESDEVGPLTLISILKQLEQPD